MKFRTIKNKCPIDSGDLRAVELNGIVLAYNCLKCGAEFEAHVHNDFENKKYFYYGKHKNPEFWTFDNKNIIEGMEISREKEEAGILPYLGYYIIEKRSY